MAIVANTFKTYESIGNREELSDMIYDISPEEVPFMTQAGRSKPCKTVHFEWQNDVLDAAVSNNAQLEGDDVTSFAAAVPTTRLGNYTQIARKTIIVSDTEDVIDKAGRKSELAYQVAKRSKEIKRDMEKGLLANQGANAGAAGTARVTGGILAFVKTNVNKGAAGVNPVYTSTPTDVRTDGTARAFTEVILKDVIQQCWTSGAEPKTVMVNSSQKQAASGFSGIATKNINQVAAKAAMIIGAADVYVSDFGTLTIQPNRFMRTKDALVLDFEYLSLSFLRPFKTVELAKTGDAEKRMLLAEYGFRCHNELAQGLATDLS